MKATIEVPDDLYRRVKAKSALQGRAIREVTVELYQTWLVEELAPPAAPSPEAWLGEWIKLGEESMKDAPPGPSARELLAEDRNRLEPKQPLIPQLSEQFSRQMDEAGISLADLLEGLAEERRLSGETRFGRDA